MKHICSVVSALGCFFSRDISYSC